MVTTLLCCTVLGASPATEPPWEAIVEEEDGIRVWRRDVAGSPAPEFRAEMIVNQPADRVWRVVSTVEEYGDFMPYILEIRVVDQEGTDTKYVYFRLDPPLVDQRDYTMKTTFTPQPDKGMWLRTWTLANDRGPPVPEDVVRLELNDGSWRLEKLGSRSTLVTYWVHTHPGGSIPDWIAKKANNTSIPNVMRAVRARAKDPTWKPD